MSIPQVFPSGTSLTANSGLEWTKEGGEVQTTTYEGNLAEILNQYNTTKALAVGFGAGNVGSLGYEANRGRARFIIRYTRENKDIEELYAVDVIRDIVEADYFSTLTDAGVIAVRTVADNNGTEVAAWTALQKTLFKHLIHHADSYIDKQFIIRTSSYVSLATAIKANLSSVGAVVSAPTLSSNMQRLIATLPAGEWLQGPITCEHLGRGRWRLDNEVQWAKKWSVIYGGTLFAP